MKIGILTQPLHDNYGGLLQAYALKEILESLGHEVVVINRHSKQVSGIRMFASIIKSKLKGRKVNPKSKLSKNQKQIISQHTLSFREKYIPNLSQLITNDKKMYELNNMGFDAYVVGSDQSWRPRYSPKIRNYFLDFAENQKGIKRISYAVSFGVSDWEFNEEDTRLCSSLAKKFDAISVREDSGITLVNDYLGMNAIHVLDPTLLLPREHYLRIVKDEKQSKSQGELKTYILDKTEEKLAIVNALEVKLGLKHFEVLPKKRLGLDKVEDARDFVYPNPAKWLRGYQDAKFVVTDSFHGTAFSILFNIPFIAIGNKRRGMARFESLLKMFGLEDRLITNLENLDVETFIQREVDWETVNSILQKERKKAMNFLKDNLE